jgi:hypothetical protein
VIYFFPGSRLLKFVEKTQYVPVLIAGLLLQFEVNLLKPINGKMELYENQVIARAQSMGLRSGNKRVTSRGSKYKWVTSIMYGREIRDKTPDFPIKCPPSLGFPYPFL